MKTEQRFTELRNMILDNEKAIEYLDEIESDYVDLRDDFEEEERRADNAEEEAEDLQKQLDAKEEYKGEQCITSFGDVWIFNETGNLALQQNIDDFIMFLKSKY